MTFRYVYVPGTNVWRYIVIFYWNVAQLDCKYFSMHSTLHDGDNTTAITQRMSEPVNLNPRMDICSSVWSGKTSTQWQGRCHAYSPKPAIWHLKGKNIERKHKSVRLLFGWRRVKREIPPTMKTSFAFNVRVLCKYYNWKLFFFN